MRNVKTFIKDGKLTIEVDVTDKVVKAAPKSGSGKNQLVATTAGFAAVEDSDFRIGLNVIR